MYLHLKPKRLPNHSSGLQVSPIQEELLTWLRVFHTITMVQMAGSNEDTYTNTNLALASESTVMLKAKIFSECMFVKGVDCFLSEA